MGYTTNCHEFKHKIFKCGIKTSNVECEKYRDISISFKSTFGCIFKLTLKAPRKKNTSENVVC